MPGEDLMSWSVTATNNGTADSSINWAEGMPRAAVNNSSRSEMAAHAKDRNLKNGSIITTGTANAQAFTSGVGYTGTVPTGLLVKLKIGPGLSNTGAATLNMDSIGAVAIKTQDGFSVSAGAILAGTYCDFLFDGTNWILLNRPSGMSLLSTQDVSAVAQVVFTGLSTDFGSYRIVASKLKPATDEAAFQMQLSTDNGSSYLGGTNYTYLWSLRTSTTALVTDSAFSGQSSVWVTPAIDTSQSSAFDSVIDLFGFGAGGVPQIMVRAAGYHFQTHGQIALHVTGCIANNGFNCNALSIFPTSGNIATGRFSLYGVP